jgi:hypothetical protein
MCKADASHPETAAQGFLGRLGVLVPVGRRTTQFIEYSRAYVHRRFKPLPIETDLSLEPWLASTGWSQVVCDRLRELARQPEGLLSELLPYKAFVKDEFYLLCKLARIIMGRVDEVKILLGPFIRAIEKVVFAAPEFVKKIPIPERATYIAERLALSETDDYELPGVVEGDDALFAHNGRVVENDITSMEAHFYDEKAELECELLCHLGREFPTQCTLLRVLCYSGQWADARNLFRGFVPAVRGSGDFQTSLGNGIANLCACSFVKTLCPGRDIEDSDWASFGFNAKCHMADTAGELSFCGMTFATGSDIMVRDPRPVLARIGWTPKKYALSGTAVCLQLFRMRCISLAFEMGRCPVLHALARRGLSVTRGVRIRQSLIDGLDEFERKRFVEARDAGVEKLGLPDMATRLFFAQRYDIPVSLQYTCERIISKWDILVPLSLPLDFPSEWSETYDEYTGSSPVSLSLEDEEVVRAGIIPGLQTQEEFAHDRKVPRLPRRSAIS